MRNTTPSLAFNWSLSTLFFCFSLVSIFVRSASISVMSTWRLRKWLSPKYWLLRITSTLVSCSVWLYICPSHVRYGFYTAFKAGEMWWESHQQSPLPRARITGCEGLAKIYRLFQDRISVLVEHGGGTAYEKPKNKQCGTRRGACNLMRNTVLPFFGHCCALGEYTSVGQIDNSVRPPSRLCRPLRTVPE